MAVGGGWTPMDVKLSKIKSYKLWQDQVGSRRKSRERTGSIVIALFYRREAYRSMLSTSRLSTSPSNTSTGASVLQPAAEPRRRCDTKLLVCALVVVGAVLLFIWAVVCNMEPAYVNPLLQMQ